MCSRWCSTRAHGPFCFPWGAPEAGATVPVTWETPHVPTLPHSGLFPAGRAGPRCTPRARVPPGSVPAPPLGDRGPPPTALRVGDVRPHDRGQGRMALPKGHSPARVGFPSGPQGPHPIKSFLHTRFLSILPGQTRSGCQRASPTPPRTSQPSAPPATRRRECASTHVCPPAPLTKLPMALPQLPGLVMAVGVTEVVGHGHVLQAVVWRRRRGLGRPVAGAVALGGAQGARPFADVVGVQRVTV